MQKSAFGLCVLSARLAFCLAGAAGAAGADVIQQGTANWQSAAKTGRADMLVIGDSVTWFGGDGWDAGFIKSASNRLGIAGTGLIADSAFTGEGEGYAAYGSYNGFLQGPANVPASRQGYVWHGVATSADTTPRSMFGFGLDGAILPTNAAYDLTVYTASAPGGGSMSAYRRINGPYVTTQSLPAVATATPAQGLQKTTFSFSATEGAELFLQNVTNTSIFYSRLTRPGVKGATVSSWGWGGHSTLSFFNDQYLQMSAAGRSTWLDALVDGGTGKLNIVLAEGFNDRNETGTSLAGNVNGSSPQAFQDNISGLISQIREDWSNAGNVSSDLSFTLLGMYDTADHDPLLRDYAAKLQQLASNDQQISFIDLYQHTPTYEAGNAAGYFADGIHLNRAGALAYADAALAALVPEPTSLAGLSLLSIYCLKRNRVKSPTR